MPAFTAVGGRQPRPPHVRSRPASSPSIRATKRSRSLQPQLPARCRHRQFGHRPRERRRHDLRLHLRDDLTSIADITGYSTTGYQPLTPTRLADTRHTTPQPAGTTLRVALPDDGGHAVTVTATRAATGGYLTAYDCTQPRPDTSTVNYVPGADTANLTLATGAELCVYTSSNVDIVVDHHGRIGGAAVVAQRLVDTRETAPLAAGDTLTIPDTTGGGTSRAINITATQPGAASHLTLHPCNTAPPPTSNLNVAPGHDTANLTIIPTTQTPASPPAATTHLIIDLTATIN